MAFNGSGFFTLTFLGRFFVKLTTAKFSQNSRFFTGALETTQGSVEILIFFYADTRHTNIVTTSNIKKPGARAGTEPHMISGQSTYCKAKSAEFSLYGDR